MNVTKAYTNTAIVSMNKSENLFDKVDQIAKLRNAMVRARQLKETRLKGIQVNYYA